MPAAAQRETDNSKGRPNSVFGAGNAMATTGRSAGGTKLGGNGARRPRNADLVASNLSDDQALDLARRLVDYYAANARAGERTARFVERVGLETIRAELLRFVPYLALEGTG